MKLRQFIHKLCFKNIIFVEFYRKKLTNARKNPTFFEIN